MKFKDTAFFVIRSRNIELGTEQDSKYQIDRIISNYKSKGYKITEYVRSRSYEFKKDAWDHRDRKEFMLRLVKEENTWFAYLEKPSYLFFVPMIMVVILSILMIVHLLNEITNITSVFIPIGLFPVFIFGVNYLAGFMEISEARSSITSIMRRIKTL